MINYFIEKEKRARAGMFIKKHRAELFLDNGFGIVRALPSSHLNLLGRAGFFSIKDCPRP
jgi:hypothetical protein